MLDGKIILVDDNEAVLKTLKMILAREFKTLVGVSSKGWRLPRTRTVSFRSWTVGRLILSCWI